MSDSTGMTSILARVVLSQGNVPAWLHEGASIYFANCSPVGGEIKHGPAPRGRVRGLQSRLRVGSCPPLTQVFSPDRGKFTPQEQSVCWAIVFWLAHSDAGRPGRGHETALEQFLSDCGTLRNAPCIAGLLGLSLDDLQSILWDWLKKLDPENPRAAAATGRSTGTRNRNSSRLRKLPAPPDAGAPGVKPGNRLSMLNSRARSATPGRPHRN